MVKPDIRGNNPGSGISDEDPSLTRDQALERFGIDLGRVGVMTSARQSLREGTGGSCITARDGGGGSSGDGAATTGTASNTGGIGRGKEDSNVSRTGSKRGRAGSLTTTTEDSRDAAAKRQELLSEKLKVLDMLLSDELPCLAPAEEGEKNKEEEAEASAQPGEDDPAIVVPEESVTENNPAVELVADLSSGGDGRGSTLDVRSLEKTPSSKALVKNSVRSCEDSQSKILKGVLVPEPNKVTAAADFHASHQKGGGEGRKGAATDVNGDVLLEKAPEKEVVDVERCHLYEKALPNHR